MRKMVTIISIICFSSLSFAQERSIQDAKRDIHIIGPATVGCLMALGASAVLTKRLNTGFIFCGGAMLGLVVVKLYIEGTTSGFRIAKDGIPPRGWDMIEGMYSGRLVLSLFSRHTIDSFARKYAAGDLSLKSLIKEAYQTSDSDDGMMAKNLPTQNQILTDIEL
jgi:hypothetical protein